MITRQMILVKRLLSHSPGRGKIIISDDVAIGRENREENRTMM